MDTEQIQSLYPKQVFMGDIKFIKLENPTCRFFTAEINRNNPSSFPYEILKNNGLPQPWFYEHSSRNRFPRKTAKVAPIQ